jgi:hypothetical protein
VTVEPRIALQLGDWSLQDHLATLQHDGGFGELQCELEVASVVGAWFGTWAVARDAALRRGVEVSKPET